MEIFNKFFSLLDNIIELNKEVREYRNDIKEIIGLNSYLKEYCTIKLEICRQIGKTEYIKRKCNKENDLIIVLKDVYRDEFEDYVYDKRDVISIRSFMNNTSYYKIKTYEKIWVDNFVFVSKIMDMDFIYDVIGREDIEQTFIFLG